jgi:hypothetical protein
VVPSHPATGLWDVQRVIDPIIQLLVTLLQHAPQHCNGYSHLQFPLSERQWPSI